MAKDQIANICTDGNYAFGVAHSCQKLWKQRGFLTSAGQPVKNGKQVAELLDVIQQLKQLAIIKTPGHSNAATIEAKGNNLADAAARQAAIRNRIIQTKDVSSFYCINKRCSYIAPTDSCRGRQEDMATRRGEPLTLANRYGLDPIRVQSCL